MPSSTAKSAEFCSRDQNKCHGGGAALLSHQRAAVERKEKTMLFGVY